VFYAFGFALKSGCDTLSQGERAHHRRQICSVTRLLACRRFLPLPPSLPDPTPLPPSPATAPHPTCALLCMCTPLVLSAKLRGSERRGRGEGESLSKKEERSIALYIYSKRIILATSARIFTLHQHLPHSCYSIFNNHIFYSSTFNYHLQLKIICTLLGTKM
jgi:hypothetical protein